MWSDDCVSSIIVCLCAFNKWVNITSWWSTRFRNRKHRNELPTFSPSRPSDPGSPGGPGAPCLQSGKTGFRNLKSSSYEVFELVYTVQRLVLVQGETTLLTLIETHFKQMLLQVLNNNDNNLKLVDTSIKRNKKSYTVFNHTNPISWKSCEKILTRTIWAISNTSR